MLSNYDRIFVPTKILTIYLELLNQDPKYGDDSDQSLVNKLLSFLADLMGCYEKYSQDEKLMEKYLLQNSIAIMAIAEADNSTLVTLEHFSFEFYILPLVH